MSNETQHRIEGRLMAEAVIADVDSATPAYRKAFYMAMKAELSKRLLETEMHDDQIVVVSTVGSHARVELFGTTVIQYTKLTQEENEQRAIIARDRLHTKLRDWAFEFHMKILQS